MQVVRGRFVIAEGTMGPLVVVICLGKPGIVGREKNPAMPRQNGRGHVGFQLNKTKLKSVHHLEATMPETDSQMSDTNV